MLEAMSVRRSATIGTGLGMLLAPLLAVAGGPMILVPWTMLLAHAVASKLRYQAFAALLEQRRMQAASASGAAAADADRLRNLGIAVNRSSQPQATGALVTGPAARSDRGHDIGRVVLLAKPGGPQTGVGRYVQMLRQELERTGVSVERVAPGLPHSAG